MQKADPEDPNRCQGTTKFGQCGMLAVPGSKYCEQHRGLADAKKNGLKNYHLTRSIIARNAAKKANSSNLKSLRDEIGIMRSVLEKVLETCQTDNDLILQAQTISQTVSQVEKLVVSCHKLEDQLNLRLDKTQIIDIVKQMVETVNAVIQEYVPEDKINDARERVSKRCFETLTAAEEVVKVL